MSIGSRLKQLRKELGLSQQELASKLNISSHSINSYESGRREPNYSAMVQLQDFFRVSGPYLQGETEERPNFYMEKKTSPESISLRQSQKNCSELLKVYRQLSIQGQEEMLRRVEEYRQLEHLKLEQKIAVLDKQTKTTISYVARGGESGTIEVDADVVEALENLKGDDIDF